MATIEGISEESNLQEALNDALKKAERSSPIKDSTLSYKVTEIRGLRGGITGENRVTIVIEAQILEGAP